MHLAPNIYVTRIDHRSIVLDLDRDRYIGLNARLSAALQSLSSLTGENHPVPGDAQMAISKLLNHGILSNQDQPTFRSISKQANISQAAITEPIASLWALLSDERSSEDAISFANTMSALVSLTQVATSLRIRSFKATISWLAKTKTSTRLRRSNWSCHTRESTQALVDAFFEVRPYFPVKPICRLDAPSLCLHLRRNGQDAQLIFGVRLDPFKAHCWVQIGDVVIDEAWDRVRQYTPILVI